MSGIWPWVTLALLGAYHGLNPGMGWLFALSLGLQEKTRLAAAPDLNSPRRLSRPSFGAPGLPSLLSFLIA